MPESAPAINERLRVIADRFEAIENKLCVLEGQSGPPTKYQTLLNRQLAILLRLTACEQRLNASKPTLGQPAAAASASKPVQSLRADQSLASSSPPLSLAPDLPRDTEAEHRQGSAVGSTQERLSRELQSRGIADFRFLRVGKEYYDQPLEYRRQQLGAQSIRQLCKSLVHSQWTGSLAAVC